MPRSYVDNAYNRRVGRVGMPVGSCVISRSGEYLGSQEYVDNWQNRNLGRVGLPRGSCPASEYEYTGYTGKSASYYESSFYTKTPDEKAVSTKNAQEKKTYTKTYPASPLSKLSEQETRSVMEFDQAVMPASPKLSRENNTQQQSEPTKEVSNKQKTVQDEGKRFDKKLEINQLKEKILLLEKESKKKETDWLQRETNLNAQVKQTDRENSNLKANLLKTDQDLVRKIQELSRVEKELENKLTIVREAKDETSDLKTRLQKIEESLLKKEQELLDMKGKLDESEKNAEGLAEVIKNYEDEQGKLADQLVIERQTTDILRERDNANKKKIVEQGDNIVQLQEQMRAQREVDVASKRKLSDEMMRLLQCVAEKDQEINRLKEIQEPQETTVEDLKAESAFVAEIQGPLETTVEDLKAESAFVADTRRKTSAKIKHYERLLRRQQIDIERERRENAYAWRLMTMLSSYMDVMQQKTSGNPGKEISIVAFTAETQALLSNLAKQDQFILQLLNEREDILARQTSHESLA